MRVSCACLKKLASDGLVAEIKSLGIPPIVTNQVIRAVYEGHDKSIGEAIVELFCKEAEHEIHVHYDEGEIAKETRKAKRKAERARRNAKLHGH